MNPEIPACFVFNGDSDGLISQHLMELSGVTPQIRVTGLKREIALLGRLPALESADIYVFDIALGSNRDALNVWLQQPGVTLRWFDHHEPGDIPQNPRLKTHIQTAAGACTALIVHQELPGSDPRWAAAAAFGDNLPETGTALLKPLGLSAEEAEALRELGVLLNYNAYGETNEDVLYPALELASRLSEFADPFDFIRHSGIIPPLREQFRADETRMSDLVPAEEQERASIFHLPAEPWARRLGSTFANRVARSHPEKAIAVLHPLQSGEYQVSIRAPFQRPGGAAPASQLAREFPTGGGRTLAAGINRLPTSEIPAFHKRFFEVYG
jgi:hypothetical protein